MYSLEDFIEMFNNGDLDVKTYFNNYDTWFSILKKKGLMGEIDPFNASDSDDWQNEYILWAYHDNRDLYYDIIQKLLGDVHIENGKIYWMGNREDLASLFCNGNRQDISQETIETILSGDGDAWEPYWDTTDDVYRDVIEELNEKNLQRLKEYIVENLSGKELSPETDEMETIATEQGHPQFWTVSLENVAKIIDDEESMKSLLSDELRDLKSELYSVHSMSYNSAYESDVWDEIWGELGKYFGNKGEWVYIPHPYKKDTQIEKYKVTINDLEGFINDYLENNKEYGTSGTLGYHGSYVGLLKEDQDCLSVRIPDYPSFRKIDENINSYFTDYI